MQTNRPQGMDQICASALCNGIYMYNGTGAKIDVGG